MSYYYSVIKDKPVGFWKLDESSGSVAYDSSGCGNSGSYIGTILESSMPLVSGGLHCNKINSSSYIEFSVTKDFSGQAGKGGFGIVNTGDNDFSLEVWFHSKSLTSLTPIFADINGLGIYWDNGNIVFKLEDYRLDYTPYYPDKYFHVVAVYTGSVMRLYVDGKIVALKSVGKINFTNESLTLQCGPSSINESFIVDAPAVYRYSLNDNQIMDHYNNAQVNSDAQIVLSDYGKLFKSTEKHQPESEIFIYPVTKGWEYFVNDNLYHNELENYLYLNPTSSSGEFIQIISLLHWKNYVSSKIEWKATHGVTVYVSSDESTWHECTNGFFLPNIDISTSKIIFVKVVFNSSNTELYIPKLEYLGLYFYDNKVLYCHNGSETILSTNGDINISNKEFPVLSRYPDNGITTSGSGIYLDTEDEIYNVEFILTPKSLGQGYVLYNKTGSIETILSLNNGAVGKSNINALYINGHDRSSETDLSNYIYIDEPNHILIKTSAAISGQISFNAKYLNGVASNILPDNTYKNISIYKDEMVDASLHNSLYTGNEIVQGYGSVMQVTEEAVKTYSRDWVVVNNG